jgi:hypothetical protein
MSITTARCHVLGTTVTCVTDLEGTVARVVCPECDHATGVCRVKQRALTGGPLAQLLGRVADDSLAAHGTRCDLR